MDKINNNKWQQSNFPQWENNWQGQKHYLFKDRKGNEYIGRRTLFNNTGYIEVETNKEINPVSWKDVLDN